MRSMFLSSMINFLVVFELAVAIPFFSWVVYSFACHRERLREIEDKLQEVTRMGLKANRDTENLLAQRKDWVKKSDLALQIDSLARTFGENKNDME